MLLSRQPRGCKASVLCISLWMVCPNMLVSRRAAVDEPGCGKVDNRRNAVLTQSRPGAIHMRSELSTVRPVSLLFRPPRIGSAHPPEIRFPRRRVMLTLLFPAGC